MRLCSVLCFSLLLPLPNCCTTEQTTVEAFSFVSWILNPEPFNFPVINHKLDLHKLLVLNGLWKRTIAWKFNFNFSLVKSFLVQRNLDVLWLVKRALLCGSRNFSYPNTEGNWKFPGGWRGWTVHLVSRCPSIQYRFKYLAVEKTFLPNKMRLKVQIKPMLPFSRIR